MKNLAKKIQQYSKKKGNKILFKGDLTLSELALQMWEKLGHQKIDTANLSRVLHGERLFTPEQLEVFCMILELNDHERSAMRYALYEDYYAKYGLEIEPSISPYFIDVVSLQLKQTAQVRNLGQPVATMEWTHILSEHIDTLIKANFVNNTHPVQKIHAQILLQQIRAYRDILYPSTIIASVKPLVGKLMDVAYMNQDKELLGKAYFSLGCAYHIAGRHKQALSVFQISLHLIKDHKLLSELLRHMALSLAYLQRKDDFLIIENQILGKLQDKNYTKVDTACEVLEGLARAQGILKIKNALTTLEQAKKLNRKMKQGEKIFVRDIQLMRSHLEIMTHLEPSEKNYLSNQAKSIRKLALDHGYKRHAQKITKFIAD